MKYYRINRILFPTDFSETSLHALGMAMDIARQQAASLILLHVVNEHLMGYQRHEMLPILSQKPLLESLRNEAGELLCKLAADIRRTRRVEVEPVTVHGQVAAEIYKAAEQHHADLIVMGTHGASGFREFFIGSHAYAVVKHAPCPVLTVPPNAEWNGFQRVLYPVRHTAGSVEKYRVLRQLLTPKKSAVHLLGFPNQMQADSEKLVSGDMAVLEKELQEDGIDFVTSLLHTPERVSAEVLSTAAEENIDLIAITASLDYDIRDFFVGPYAQQIVNHAKTPVLSIRPFKMPVDLKQTVKVMRADYGPALPDLALGFNRVPAFIPGLGWI